MTREEILSKSRNENKAGDERDLQLRLKANRIAKAFGIAIAFLFVFIDSILFDVPAIGWTALTIAFGMNTIEDWVFVFSAKKSTEWATVIFDTVFFLISVVMFAKAVM